MDAPTCEIDHMDYFLLAMLRTNCVDTKILTKSRAFPNTTVTLSKMTVFSKYRHETKNAVTDQIQSRKIKILFLQMAGVTVFQKVLSLTT